MLSTLLHAIPGLNVDASGRILNAEPVKEAVKKTVKRVVKKAATAAATAAATETANAQAAANAAEAAAAQAAAAAAELAAQTPSAIGEFVSSLDPVVTAAVIGLIVIVAFYIYRTRFSSTGQRGDTFLLLGTMGSGKTALYFKLKQGVFRETYTSMKENDATFVPVGLEGKVSAQRFVDLPGHASQRVKLDAIKPTAKGVVFVVDATTPDALAKVSQFLYTLLVDPIFVARRTPFFIAVSKQEMVNSSDDSSSSADAKQTKGKDTDGSGSEGEDESEGETESSGNAAVSRIASRLEALLDTTRGLQSTMADLGDGETAVRPLGREGQKFKFSHSACPIRIGGVSAAKGQLDDLMQFIQSQ